MRSWKDFIMVWVKSERKRPGSYGVSLPGREHEMKKCSLSYAIDLLLIGCGFESRQELARTGVKESNFFCAHKGADGFCLQIKASRTNFLNIMISTD